MAALHTPHLLRSLVRPARHQRGFASTPVALSQIGKAPLAIPHGVTLGLPQNVASAASPRTLVVTGPLGETTLSLPPAIVLHPSSNTLTLSVQDPSAGTQKAVWGLTRALLANALTGVSEGYRLALRLVGVGYRANVEDIPQSLRDIATRIPTSRTAPSTTAVAPTQRLNLKLGYAHPIYIDIPTDITVTTPQPTRIVLSGTDKQRLGLFAAKIRRWRKPEPYRGKGIFVGDETIKIKEVKKK